MAYYLTMLEKRKSLKEPGQIIMGRYEVVKPIGRGATGEVYIVGDKEKDNILIALKYLTLDPELTAAIHHFKSEFHTMTHLNHPNIAKVYDFGWDDELELYYFTSELIDGRDFVSASFNLEIEQVEELFIQALRALEYLHSRGIYHFDIKPHNLLVQSAGAGSRLLKVIDFGLASGRTPEKIIGTPSFIAPEIVRKAQPDGRADLYSLGVVLYYALTRVNPFKSDDPNKTLANQLTYTPPATRVINPKVPKYLDSIIMKLIEKDKKDRYQTAAEVIRDLNFRSQRFHAIETPETLLSYVPWEGPFIGRPEERRAFKEWLKAIDADEGAGALFWIRGGRGSGKSRFLDECKKIAQLKIFNTVIVDAIDNKLFAKITKQKERTIIVIDDMEKKLGNCRNDTAIKFHSLLHKAPLLITSSNNDDAVSSIKSFLAGRRIQITYEIDIKNFTLDEIKEYIQNLTGLAEAPMWLAGALFDYSGGNPLFLTETMKQMITDGLLFGKAGRWKKTTMEDMGLNLSQLTTPSAPITSIIAEEFDSLSDVEKEAAFLISVCRSPLKKEMAAEIFDGGGKEALEALKRRGIIRTNVEDSWLFRDTLTKRFFYANMPEERRRALHDFLYGFFSKTGADKELLEYHACRGGDDSIAKKSLIAALEKTENDARALELITEYLGRFKEASGDKIVDLYIRKADIHSRARNFTAAHETYERFFSMIPPVEKAPETHFKANVGLGLLFLNERRFNEAVSSFRKAKEIAIAKNDAVSAIIAENHLAYVDILIGNNDYAIEKYIATREAAKKLPKDERRKITNNGLGFAYKYKGEVERAAEILKDDEKFFREIGETRQLCKVLVSLGEIYNQERKYEQAERCFNEVIKFSKETGSIEILHKAYHGLGNLLNEKGIYADSIGYLDRALDLALHMENFNAAVSLLISIAIIYSNTGNNKSAFDTLQTALAFLEGEGFPINMKDLYLCRIHLELGELYRLNRNFAMASHHLEKSMQFAKKPEAKIYLFWILLTQAKLAKDVNDIYGTKRLIKEAKKLADSSNKKELLNAAKKYAGI